MRFPEQHPTAPTPPAPPRSFNRRQALGLGAGAGVALLAACGQVKGGNASSAGAAYPTHAVELTVPFDPGGSSDLIGRAVAKSIARPLGEPLVVVNKPGANGAVGGKQVLGSKPDGYSLVELPKTLFSITPIVVDDPDAIQFSDMRVISGLTAEEYLLVVNAKSPYRNLDDLLAAKKTINYGTAGVGTGSQFSQALLFGTAKVKSADVPFDGSAPAVTALLAEEVDAASVAIAESIQQIEAGKLRPLVLFSEKRSEFQPDVPTAKEQGYDIVVDQRRVIAGPKDLPEDVVKTFGEALRKAFRDPKYAAFLKDNYIARWEVGGEAAERHFKRELDTYRAMADRLGIRFEGGKA